MFSNDKELEEIRSELSQLNSTATNILQEIRHFKEYTFKNRLEEIEKRLRELQP